MVRVIHVLAEAYHNPEAQGDDPMQGNRHIRVSLGRGRLIHRLAGLFRLDELDFNADRHVVSDVWQQSKHAKV